MDEQAETHHAVPEICDKACRDYKNTDLKMRVRAEMGAEFGLVGVSHL